MYKDGHPGPQYSGRCSLASVPLSPKSDTGNCLWGGISSDLTTHLFSRNCVLKRVPSPTAQLPPQEPTSRECLQGALLALPLPPRLSDQTEILLPGLLILAQQHYSSHRQVLGTSPCVSWCQGSCSFLEKQPFGQDANSSRNTRATSKCAGVMG